MNSRATGRGARLTFADAAIYNEFRMLVPLLAGTAAVVAAGYNTMAPRSQLYGRTFIGEPPTSRRLALTFDDGPNDPYTLHLLDVLGRHGVCATFFLLGRFVHERPDIARAVAEAGHVIGNHSFTHPNLIFRSGRQIRQEIDNCQRALTDGVGEPCRLFRPPHGGRTPAVLRLVRQMGYEPVMWSVSGWDWNTNSPEQIVRVVRRQVRGGDVILLHDGGHERMGTDRSASVAATDLLIRRYHDEGYEFVTVPKMMKAAASRG